MRKWTSLFLALMMCLSLCACGKATPEKIEKLLQGTWKYTESSANEAFGVGFDVEYTYIFDNGDFTYSVLSKAKTEDGQERVLDDVTKDGRYSIELNDNGDNVIHIYGKDGTDYQEGSLQFSYSGGTLTVYHGPDELIKQN